MKEVALACTGGGVKSAINIGVIRGLEELGIKITAISGASLGSCVAILYAMGNSSKEIKIPVIIPLMHITKTKTKN